MKLDNNDKKRLAFVIIKEFVELKRQCIDDDILQRFESETPKSIMKKLTGDINDKKSEVSEYDRDAQRLIKKFFRKLPDYINDAILGVSEQ